MPIYEYACGRCESEFEVEQRITDSPLKTCPRCRSRKIKRLISRTSFVLKGGGWYSDLYASSSAKRDKTDSGDEKPAAQVADSKSEAKSASKSDDGAKPSGPSSAERKGKGKGSKAVA